MKATELYPEGIRHVVHNMRAKDCEEIYATQWTDDPAHLAQRIVHETGDFGFVLHTEDGEPAICCGAVPMWNGVWSVWMFATDRFDEIALPFHKWTRRVFFPALDHAGWHRLECRSSATHDVAHRWLEVLGAYKESEVTNYGKRGELFFLYCWTKEPSTTQSP